VWQRVVAGIGALLDTEVSVTALVAVPIAALLVALLVATVPGRRAARLSPAAILRTE
jgi:ABC-type lipoprotein release transport system permease subunit